MWPSSGSRRRRWARASAAARRTCSSETSLGAVERGEGAGGARADDVAAHPVDPELRAGGGDPQQLALGQPDGRQPRARVGDAPCQRALLVRPARAERRRVLLVGEPAADDLGADRRVGGRADVDAQGEAVQELRAQVALLDVHRPDEDEAGVVLGRDRLALDARDRGGGGVEQRVDEVVGQQVDLVDVEDPLVGAGEQPGLEGLLAGQARAPGPGRRRAGPGWCRAAAPPAGRGARRRRHRRAPRRRARARRGRRRTARPRPRGPAGAAARGRARRSTWPCRARRARARRRRRGRPR